MVLWLQCWQTRERKTRSFLRQPQNVTIATASAATCQDPISVMQKNCQPGITSIVHPHSRQCRQADTTAAVGSVNEFFRILCPRGRYRIALTFRKLALNGRILTLDPYLPISVT